MSLLDKKLSALLPGSAVCFTDRSGQIIQGIVTENDGQESIAVQITSSIIIRYDQIGTINELGQLGAVSRQVPTIEQAPILDNEAKKPAVIEVLRLSGNPDSIKKTYKAMESAEKKELGQAYNIFQGFLKSHEENKYTEAVNSMRRCIRANEWDSNPRVNLLLAYIQLHHKNYSDAAESFFSAGNCRYAYCTAYQAAEEDSTMYQLSAAFAVVYLLSDSPEEASEALEVLRKSSVISKDISGIDYAVQNSKSADIKQRLTELLKDLGKNYAKSADELSDTKKLLACLKEYYPNALIEKKITNLLSKTSVKEPLKNAEPEAPESESGKEPDTAAVLEGKIIAYSHFNKNGTIKTDDGNEYYFDLANITDALFQIQVKRIYSSRFEPIPVKFTASKTADKLVASNIKRGATVNLAATEETPAEETPVEDTAEHAANRLISAKDYTGAMEIYKQHMDDDNWEFAFAKIIQCYLALNNENEGMGYLEELRAFVDEYNVRPITNTVTLEALLQFYTKVNDYENSLRLLNKLTELCGENELFKTLHYIILKAHCYRYMKDYRSAISELLAWVDTVARRKIADRYQHRDLFIYLELGELYFESGDYVNAKKYLDLSVDSARKRNLQTKLDKKLEKLAENDAKTSDEDSLDDETEILGAFSEPEESLQAAYEAYTDAEGFDVLNIDDAAIIAKAFSFDANHLYCLLTYLHSAAEISAGSEKTRTDEMGNTVHVSHVVKSVNAAAAYAFNSPLEDSEYLSTSIIAIFAEAKKYLPDSSGAMFAASALYALFNTPSVPDYSIDDFSVVLESYDLNRYPALLPLTNDLVSFREYTGCGMDSFANYKAGALDIEAIVNEANECCKSVDMRNDVYESQGQVRRLREYMFSSSGSELRECLNIVAENNLNRYQSVKDTITKLFIRSGKSVSIDNVDMRKVDEFIDRFWDMAKDTIRNEGRHIARPRDKIKGSKRNNIVLTIYRILSCICDWLSVAEHSIGHDNDFALSRYDELLPTVTSELNHLIASCDEISSETGFDWGNESLRRAAEEILAKINGAYSSKARRYFFIDFLKGEDILLNDSFLPETQSTFCAVPDFNILFRIEKHASSKLPELHDRFTQILSNDESKHDFRAARLIKAYGEDMGIQEITGHKNLPQYTDCLKQANQRFENKNQEFAAELELCESYGTISNLNGEKDKILAISDSWYRICTITGDYGFYVRLLDAVRSSISVNAEKKGELLKRQLNDIASKSQYNFGVYSKEMIEEKIDDQNFSSAEYIMSCILHRDVNAIPDYSEEPFGYFYEFTNEYRTNLQTVRDAGRGIVDTILDYSHKKDLELAINALTNNAHKETRGGVSLLKSWIPRSGSVNAEQLTALLTRLGFKPSSVQEDTSCALKAHVVHCRKQPGKVNYVHHIPAFGSASETEGFRVICLYGTYNCDGLIDKFKEANSTAKNTIVFLDFAMNLEERRKLARKIKEERTFSKTFIVVDRIVIFYLAKHYSANTIIKRLLAVTLPFAYYQPFVESSMQDMPPELFTGREAELTSIESPNGANLVYGGRQLGKSALLKMARRNIDKNGSGDRAVLIDIRGISANDALEVVRSRLIAEDILDESCKCETWNDLAGHIYKRLMSDDPEKRINYFLLMLDEADKFIETSVKADNQPITALKNLPSDRFKLVMAGLHNLSRYNRTLMHGNSTLIHLTPITIRQFRREEATKLLTSILAYLGFKFTQNIIDNILASTYNYPGLIQFYCQKLLEAMKNDDYAGYGQNNTPPYEVTEDHYKKILSDKAFIDLVDQKFEATLFVEEEGSDHSNYHIIALILAYLYCTEPNDAGYTEADLLRVAQEYNIRRVTLLHAEQFSEILNEMCDLNVIAVMDGCYRFVTDGFRKYLGNQEKIEKSMFEYMGEDLGV